MHLQQAQHASFWDSVLFALRFKSTVILSLPSSELRKPHSLYLNDFYNQSEASEGTYHQILKYNTRFGHVMSLSLK
jgi:hypothetical protein